MNTIIALSKVSQNNKTSSGKEIINRAILWLINNKITNNFRLISRQSIYQNGRKNKRAKPAGCPASSAE